LRPQPLQHTQDPGTFRIVDAIRAKVFEFPEAEVQEHGDVIGRYLAHRIEAALEKRSSERDELIVCGPALEPERVRHQSDVALAEVGFDDLNGPDDVLVKLCELRGGNLKFLVLLATNDAALEAGCVGVIYLEARHEAGL